MSGVLQNFVVLYTVQKRLYSSQSTELLFTPQVEPDWLFDQCITTLSEVARTNGIETHIEQMIVTAEQKCLLSMSHR